MKLVRLFFALILALSAISYAADEPKKPASPWKLICFKNETTCRSLWSSTTVPGINGASVQVAYNVKMTKKKKPKAIFAVNLNGIELANDQRAVIVATDTSQPMSIPIVATDPTGASAELSNPETINKLLDRMERATTLKVTFEAKTGSTTVDLSLRGFKDEMEYMISGDALVVKY